MDAPDVVALIDSLVGAYAGRVDTVVLGCTHYPFVREQIREVLGDVAFFDSAQGTARQLRRRLSSAQKLNNTQAQGRVEFFSSKDTKEELALYRQFFEWSKTL